MKAWLVIGCGYVGRRLALRLLNAGHEVTVSSRSEEGCCALAESMPTARVVRYQPGERIQSCSGFQVVAMCAPPGPDAPEPERMMALQLGPEQRLLYLSTTGVYPRAHGNVVDDTYPTGPESERGRRRHAVERALAQEHPSSVALRIPSIYGPGRGVHARMRTGRYTLVGAADTPVSRIYVDDLVAAIMLLGATPSPLHESYVIGDENPTSATEHAFGIARRLGIDMPASKSESEVSATARAMLGAGRRIVPTRLLSLGWRAQYPSWREGLEEALRAEGVESG